MTTNEQTLDGTYNVYYIDDFVIPVAKHLDHGFNGRDNRNYIEAIELAIHWMKKYPILHITDGSSQIVVDSNGVTLPPSDTSHPHHLEHLKIMEDLETVRRELRHQ